MSSGPFSSIVEGYTPKPTGNGVIQNCRVRYRSSTWYRSGTRSRHQTKPLPYNVTGGIVERTRGLNQFCDAANELGKTTLTDSRWINLAALVSNRALSKFVSDAQDEASASLGETLGEWKQSEEMIVARMRQLADLARALRRRDLSGVARALNSAIPGKSKRSLKDKSKSFGDLWLEFHFGWVPLVGDIFGALEAVARDPSRKPVLGKAKTFDYYVNTSSYPLSWQQNSARIYIGRRHAGKVHVVNPNVALLAALGLINPASVAWNLVPYSFVVDWFWDIGGFIGGLDGLLGCELEDTYSTELRRGSGLKDVRARLTTSSPWEQNSWTLSNGWRVVRTLGLPPYQFTFPNFPRFSWQRAVTATALLLGLL